MQVHKKRVRVTKSWLVRGAMGSGSILHLGCAVGALKDVKKVSLRGTCIRVK